MPTFFVLSGPEIGRRLAVEEGAVLGRSPECAAPLRGTSISRRHARLERSGETWVLVDLDSRNGIVQHDRRVARLELEDGAVFLLGEVELRFRVGAGAAAPPVVVPPPEGAPPLPEALPLPPPPSASPGPRLPAAGGLEVEEIELDQAGSESPAAPVSAPRPARPSAARAYAEELARTSAARPRPARGGGSARVHDPGRDVLQFHRIPDRHGLLVSDLGQHSGWMRFLALFVALAVFGGVFYLAFRGTAFLRESASGFATGPATEDSAQ